MWAIFISFKLTYLEVNVIFPKRHKFQTTKFTFIEIYDTVSLTVVVDVVNVVTICQKKKFGQIIENNSNAVII